MRASCKSLVDSSSRFRPLAMPRRVVTLLAGRARRSAVRSMVLRCIASGTARQAELTESNLGYAAMPCWPSQIEVPGDVLATPSAATGAVGRANWAFLARSWQPRARPRHRDGPPRLAFLAGAAPRVRRRRPDGGGVLTPPGAFPQRLRKKGSIEVDLTEHTAKLVQPPALAPQPQPSPRQTAGPPCTAYSPF